MNCREGDLAVIVKSWRGHEGKIVRCVKFLGMRPFLYCGVQPTWLIEPSLGMEHGMFFDGQLRPIRDPGDEAQDESLSWKKVPSTDKREELA